MKDENYLFKIIELLNYDVIVPFICYKCGNCCRKFTPQIPANDLPKIAKYLNIPPEEIAKQHSECYGSKFTDYPNDCLFLNEQGKCLIYPIRPEPCRLYPLFSDFGDAGVNCPGSKEFKLVSDNFFKGRK